MADSKGTDVRRKNVKRIILLWAPQCVDLPVVMKLWIINITHKYGLHFMFGGQKRHREKERKKNNRPKTKFNTGKLMKKTFASYIISCVAHTHMFDHTKFIVLSFIFLNFFFNIPFKKFTIILFSLLFYH